MNTPIKPTSMTLQIGQIIALVTAVSAGATKMTTLEADAKEARDTAAETKAEIKDVRSELRRQRELLARLEGDSRAILQILRMRGGNNGP